MGCPDGGLFFGDSDGRSTRGAPYCRSYCTGYLAREQSVGWPQGFKPSLRIDRCASDRGRFRRPVQRSLGCHVAGVALPMADRVDLIGLISGIRQRFGRQPPQRKLGVLRRLRSFVRNFLITHVAPLPEDADIGFEKWLENAPYTIERKLELRRVFEDHPVLTRRDYRCKSFAKLECYDEYKHVRLINSRSDAFKVHTGPFFSAVEHSIFDPSTFIGRYFIKRIPVADRPAWLEERLGHDGSLYTASDFSAFESLIEPDIFRAVEFQLYAHMAKRLGARGAVLTHITRALAGTNRCNFADIRVKVDGCRMSGDMCTSLGNGFTNLMLWLFLCHEKHLVADGVVEGDDGIFRVVDHNGSPACVTAADFASLGFRAKLVSSQNLGQAGFCKLYYSDVAKENIVDPGSTIAGLGWTHSSLMHCAPDKLDMLLRAKADSLLSMYPRCPIVTACGLMVRRCLGDGERRYEGVGGRQSWWERYLAENCSVDDGRISRGVPEESRTVMYEIFGITPNYQRAVERYFNSVTKLGVLDFGILSPLMRPTWTDYYNKHCYTFGAGTMDTWPGLG